MPNFSNTSAPRDFSDLIPKGTVAPMYARIKRGGYGDHGLLTLASTEKGQSAYLHLEITIADGSHKGRKFWTRLTVEGAKTARELPGIVDQVVTMNWIDFGDRKPVRAFVCTNPNPWGYPAKDRSGKLEQLEPPNLGALIEKLTGPGQRKPFTVVSPEQRAAQT